MDTALTDMAKNPQYWLSFLQTAGESYESAKEDGASELQASSYAMVNGLLNSLVEVGGGGIQELPGKLSRGAASALKEWVFSAIDEGKEEVVQGVIERGLQNLMYSKDNPLLSVTDEEAVFNPKTSAKEFGLGATVGGLLSGGQVLVQSGINTAAENTIHAKSAKALAEAGYNAAQADAQEYAPSVTKTAGKTKTASTGETDVTLVQRIQQAIPSIQNMEPVATVTGNELPKSGKIVDRLTQFVNAIGNKVNRPGFGDVLFSKGRIKNSVIGHGAGQAKIETFAAVPAVIQNGAEIDHQVNWKGRGYDTYTFAAPVTYQGQQTYLGVIVTKDIQDGRYYVHEVVDETGNIIFENKENAEVTSDGRASLSGTVDTVVTSTSDPTVAQTAQGVNTQNAQNSAGVFTPESGLETPVTEAAGKTKTASAGETKSTGETISIIQGLRNNIPSLSKDQSVFTVSSQTVQVTEGRTMAEKAKHLFEKIKGTVTRLGFGDVEINTRAVKDDLSHGIGPAKAAVIPAIPSVIQNGAQIDFQQNWKGRPYDGYVFAAPVTMDGNTVYVAAVVKQTTKNRFYLHEVVDSNGNIIKIGSEEGANPTSLAANGDAGTQSSLPSETPLYHNRRRASIPRMPKIAREYSRRGAGWRRRRNTHPL